MQQRPPRRLRAPRLAAIVAALALLAGCGGGDHGDHGGGSAGAAGAERGAAAGAAGAERGFLGAMVPHHESAIEMARVALTRAEHPQVRRLAGEIVAAQEAEIRRMRAIHRRLFDEPLEPDEGGHAALGLDAEEAGMGHGEAAKELASASPFDRAFLDEMVPHHEGAVRMAQALLERTDDGELKKLAGEILASQRREIDAMRSWRERWYGAAPAEREDGHGGGDGGSGDGHDGHSG